MAQRGKDIAVPGMLKSSAELSIGKMIATQVPRKSVCSIMSSMAFADEHR